MSFILDASALTAVLLEEPGAERVVARLNESIMLSTNLAEVAAVVGRGGVPDDDVVAALAKVRIPIVAPDEALALTAGHLRKTTDAFGLSLADRLCLAFARRYAISALTADRAWSKAGTAIGAHVILIR